MDEKNLSPLRKQAWDYFSTHASQRLSTFNFYLVLSSLITTSYFASFKSDMDLSSVRPALSTLLSLFAFIFWKLDSRNKALIKNAERALKHFEGLDDAPLVAKVFTQEEAETRQQDLRGWRRILVWKASLSYSDCFNVVFCCFFFLGLLGLFLPNLLHVKGTTTNIIRPSN